MPLLKVTLAYLELGKLFNNLRGSLAYLQWNLSAIQVEKECSWEDVDVQLVGL